MKKLLVLLLLLGGAGYWAWTSGKLNGRSWIEPMASARQPEKATASTVAEPEADVLAQWHSCGMPSLDANWDAQQLRGVVEALRQLKARSPAHLPDARSAAGKAFFSKLRYTAGRFHLLGSLHKISTYNAFREILPVYAKGPSFGRSRDLEVALLIGLQVELIAGVMQDQAYVKNISDRTTRTSGSLDGGTWIMSGEAISFAGGARGLETDTRELLQTLSNRGAFGPEARKLALSLLVPHLPIIARRADMNDLGPLVQKQRAQETDPEVRAYYDTLLARL